MDKNIRKFQLPSHGKLKKAQKEILRLPESEEILITGGPGTGKSVVSLMRRLTHSENQNYIFLVYNKVLLLSTKQMVEGNVNGSTWKKWLNITFEELTSKEIPKKPIDSNKNDFREIDFDKTILKIQEFFKDRDFPSHELNFIIDEGQDMPPKFYEALYEMGYKNFFVVADQNQQITDLNSNIRELKEVLNVDKIYKLTENFRNSFEIAVLAQQFYADTATEPPALPEPEPKVKLPPTLFDYEDSDDAFISLNKRILKTSDTNPSDLIGIFTFSNPTRLKYLNTLRDSDIKREHPKPIISTYSSNDFSPKIDFSRGGIVVLNSASVKGLEFDVVFIADIDEFNKKPSIDALKKIFYVMTSRSIKKLFLLRNNGHRRHTKLDDILPTDEDILKRASL
jgi:superfamily I DNA/RNA helicase